MTLRISRKISRNGLRGISRRRFLAGAGAAGVVAMPYLSRAADRPVVTSGVQSGDIGADGGVVWARADRPSQMLVEVATTESFANAKALPPIAALPESDFVDHARSQARVISAPAATAQGLPARLFSSACNASVE